MQTCLDVNSVVNFKVALQMEKSGCIPSRFLGIMNWSVQEDQIKSKNWFFIRYLLGNKFFNVKLKLKINKKRCISVPSFVM